MMRSSGLASSTFSVALRYLLDLFDRLFFAGIVVACERCDEYRGEVIGGRLVVNGINLAYEMHTAKELGGIVISYWFFYSN